MLYLFICMKGKLNMKKNNNYILSKIYKNIDFATTFLNGKLNINNLSSFGIGNLFESREEMDNLYRGDMKEGLKSIIPEKEIEHCDSIYDFYNAIRDDISYEDIVFGELDSRFLNEFAMSFFALYYDSDNDSFIAPDKKMLDFDSKQKGATIIIYDVQEFLRRLIFTLTDTLGSPFWFAYGLVNYYLSSEERNELCDFTKEKSYEYQKEFRVAIDFGALDFKVNSDVIKYDSEKKMIEIDIGDISDIAFLIPTADFINLKFPEKYNDVLHTLPKPICPFYPPVKGVNSYVCPVFYAGGEWFYGKKALYPIIRDTKSYYINGFFADKTREMVPENDLFFVEISNMYFRHLLDIYKSESDGENLSSLLSAIVKYMIMIQILNLADVKLTVDYEGIQPSYHNLNVTDTRLLDKKNLYYTVSRPPICLLNTDFAELASISDDTVFPEYEMDGKKYYRIVVNRNATLSSGRKVKKGEAVWVEVSKVEFFEVPPKE